MFALFDVLKKQIKFSRDHGTIESIIFKLMKLCMLATLASVILVTAKTYVGDNINCITGFEKQQHKAIETYCYISSTYTLVNFSANAQPYRGVGQVDSEAPDDSHLIRHSYYQWVPLVLTMQTFLLYLPKWFWKQMADKGQFMVLLNGLHKLHVNDFNRGKDIQNAARYFKKTMHSHFGLALRFHLSEILAVGIALGNLFLTNSFLGGHFFDYGISSFKYLGADKTDIDNPLNEIFPKVAKCTWRKYGPSGTIQFHDSLCVLPMNIVNEKTYTMLWLVYMVSYAVMLYVLMYHILLMVVSGLRTRIIMKSLRSEESRSAYTQLRLGYGDWFLLKHLAHRMEKSHFQRFVVELARLMEKH